MYKVMVCGFKLVFKQVLVSTWFTAKKQMNSLKYIYDMHQEDKLG